MLARVLLGAQVHSFDPSPTGEAYISRLRRQGRMPDGMHYHKLGIADRALPQFEIFVALKFTNHQP